MPLLGINMAQPCNRESQVYILPTTDVIEDNMDRTNKKKYIIIKMVELVCVFHYISFLYQKIRKKGSKERICNWINNNEIIYVKIIKFEEIFYLKLMNIIKELIHYQFYCF